VVQTRVFYRPNPAGQTAVLHSPNGMVADHMRKIGNLTQTLARQHVGKKTGKLAKSIKPYLTSASTGLVMRVGSDNKIALLHHEGTRRHIIRARNARALAFVWHGKLVFRRSVNHPGTRANPYLVIAMSQAVGRSHRL
jgi:hypothetical protein